MRNEAVCKMPYTLRFVPERFKIQEIYDEVVLMYPYLLGYIADHFKTQ